MEPLITAGLLGAGASIVNGITGFIGGQKSADMSAQVARQNLKDQLAWERERATNAYQWAAEDLEKAGLNKNLLNQHTGAAVTGNLTPQMPDTSGYQSAYNAMGNMIKDGVNTALTVKQKLSEIENINAKTQNEKEDSALKRAYAITEARKQGLISTQTEHEFLKREALRMRNELDSKYAEYERIAGLSKQVSGIAKDIITPFATFFGLGKFAKMLPKTNKRIGFGMTKNGTVFNKRTGEIVWD